MQRLAFVLLLSCAGGFLPARQPAHEPAHEPASAVAQAPNILLILADDLGQGDLACYNAASKVPTPRLDAFAAQGMLWTDAHSPSAVCTPTRYGLLTGRYCWRSALKQGVLFGFDPALIEPGRPTLASELRGAGYTTAAIGKWHLGLGGNKPTDYTQLLKPGPLEVGFDTFFGIPASLDMPPYVFVRDHRPEQAASERIGASRPARNGGGGFWREGDISPGFRMDQVLPRITAEAEAYLMGRGQERRQIGRPQGQEGQPFFLYVPLSAPHTPWLPAKEFRGRSQAGVYGDFATMVDASIGAILDALERSGRADDTLVIITSDNGAHWTPGDRARFGHLANNHRRGQKADIWEAGHRVPFLVRWPGRVAPASRSDALLCLTDLYATCLSAAGVKPGPEGGEDSINQLALLLGSSPPSVALRTSIVHHSLHGMYAVRKGPWKLILGLGSGGFSAPRTIEPVADGPSGQLYNLHDDPAESTNLYLEHPEVVRELEELLQTWREKGRSVPR